MKHVSIKNQTCCLWGLHYIAMGLMFLLMFHGHSLKNSILLFCVQLLKFLLSTISVFIIITHSFTDSCLTIYLALLLHLPQFTRKRKAFCKMNQTIEIFFLSFFINHWIFLPDGNRGKPSLNEILDSSHSLLVLSVLLLFMALLLCYSDSKV